MKNIIFTFLIFMIALTTVNAQKGIDFSKRETYQAGYRLAMSIDSLAKNISNNNRIPNQPHTYFNYLPNVNNISIQIAFIKKDSVQNWRYTIFVDSKPIVVNKSIDKTQLVKVDTLYKVVFSHTTLGIFPIKDKVITVIVYNIRNPLDVYKVIFYGKPIQKAKIKTFATTTVEENSMGGTWTPAEKDKTSLTFLNQNNRLIITKDSSDIDFLYYTYIKNKQTNEIMFESNSWQYDDALELSPYVMADKNIFKKSGDYEVIIKPIFSNGLSDPLKDIEKYTSRYTISVNLDEENYSKKELLIVALSIGLPFLLILYFIKKRNKKKLEEKEQQKNIAKLQLNSIRSQLNPHFLFNALSGIQNLMNKNETDNANKYLSKFARLTRNVLDDKELISLSQEKTLLDDYLQMEQLRFGFNYEINIAESLALENIEIPGMLLQPFVENAVKHGISQKAIDGKIIITFMRKANDLVLTVSDNGNGFDTEKKNVGLGLSLSESRIALLNSIYKENYFMLDMQSSSAGTKVNLTLTDWL